MALQQILFAEALAAVVPWAVTDQGATTNGVGNTLARAVPATIAAGSLVVVCVCEAASLVAGGTVADAAGNIYTSIAKVKCNNSTTFFGQIFYSVLTTQLSAGQNVTYTKQTSGNAHTAMAVLSATGNGATPLDTSVTATAFGSSTTPTVTSGIPGVSGELFVGFLAFGGASFTVDTGHGWAAPPATASVGTNDASVGGGNQVNAGTGTKIHAPTLALTRAWADFIVGFKH